MPQLQLDIPHVLTQDEAARRLKQKFDSAMAEHEEHLSDFSHQWEDHKFTFAFKALGMAVSGIVAVEPERVRLDAKLPLAAAFFKGMIENQIRQEVGDLLVSEAGGAGT